jgi:hypothetical protein
MIQSLEYEPNGPPAHKYKITIFWNLYLLSDGSAGGIFFSRPPISRSDPFLHFSVGLYETACLLSVSFLKSQHCED